MKRTIFFLLFAGFTTFMSIGLFAMCYENLDWVKFGICALPLVLTAVCLFELTIVNPIFKK
jgi:hypothetical protein